MNVVDSSAWLEYFADGPNASFFAEPIEPVSLYLRSDTGPLDRGAPFTPWRRSGTPASIASIATPG